MNKLTDESPMPFGEYEGVAMANVPAERLVWYYEQIAEKDNPRANETAVKEYVENYLPEMVGL